MFHSLKIAAAAIVVGMSSMPEEVSAQSRETIQIRNRSGVTLYIFRATDSRYDTFGEDLLGSRVLNSGVNWDLTFSNVTNCIYDFRMEFSDGSVSEDYGVDICRTSRYTIN